MEKAPLCLPSSSLEERTGPGHLGQDLRLWGRQHGSGTCLGRRLLASGGQALLLVQRQA